MRIANETSRSYASRWRGGRGYDPHRQRYQGGSLRDRPMGGGGGGGGHDNDRHGSHRNHGNNVGGPQAWGPPPAAPGQEQHVSVRGFNSAEAKDALKKGIVCSEKGGVVEVHMLSLSILQAAKPGALEVCTQPNRRRLRNLHMAVSLTIWCDIQAHIRQRTSRTATSPTTIGPAALGDPSVSIPPRTRIGFHTLKHL